MDIRLTSSRQNETGSGIGIFHAMLASTRARVGFYKFARRNALLFFFRGECAWNKDSISRTDLNLVDRVFTRETSQRQKLYATFWSLKVESIHAYRNDSMLRTSRPMAMGVTRCLLIEH